MRRRLFWGLVTVAAVTVIITTVLTVFFVGNTVESRSRDDLRRQAEATGHLVEAELSALSDERVTDRTQLGTVIRLLEVSRRIGGHDYLEAVFLPPTGRTVPIGDLELIPALPAEVLGDTGQATYLVRLGEERVFAVTNMLATERGHLLIAIGSTQDLVPWGELLRRFAFTLLVAVALASVLAVWLSRSLSRRMTGLADAAAAVASGDLTTRVPDTGRDEVAEVAGAFNEMADRLQAAQARERDFLMSVSHDLRTPLTTIRGYAEGLAEDSVPEADIKRVGGVLHAQAGRLSRLIEDLMLLSRLEARQFTLRTEPVGLAAHLDEVVAGFEARAEEARVSLETELEDVGTVVVDPDRVAQVTANLIENALRYTPEGGSVTVRLSADGADGIRLEVADTGPGIDEEDLPHVFERLYVARRYRPVRPEGSGLGLSIVKELVDSMKGSVMVASRVGEGTRVTVVLPDSS